MVFNLNYPFIFPLLPPQKIFVLLTHCQALCLLLCPSVCLSTGLSRFFQCSPIPASECLLALLSPSTNTLKKYWSNHNKLQYLCNLMSCSHRLCVVSSNSMCFVTVCSGPGQYLPLFTCMLSTAWWGIDRIPCLLHQFSSISTFKRHPAISLSYHPVCSLTAKKRRCSWVLGYESNF